MEAQIADCHKNYKDLEAATQEMITYTVDFFKELVMEDSVSQLKLIVEKLSIQEDHRATAEGFSEPKSQLDRSEQRNSCRSGKNKEGGHLKENFAGEKEVEQTIPRRSRRKTRKAN